MAVKRMLGGERTSLTGDKIQRELISMSITLVASVPTKAIINILSDVKKITTH